MSELSELEEFPSLEYIPQGCGETDAALSHKKAIRSELSDVITPSFDKNADDSPQPEEITLVCPRSPRCLLNDKPVQNIDRSLSNESADEKSGVEPQTWKNTLAKLFKLKGGKKSETDKNTEGDEMFTTIPLTPYEEADNSRESRTKSLGKLFRRPRTPTMPGQTGSLGRSVPQSERPKGFGAFLNKFRRRSQNDSGNGLNQEEEEGARDEKEGEEDENQEIYPLNACCNLQNNQPPIEVASN